MWILSGEMFGSWQNNMSNCFTFIYFVFFFILSTDVVSLHVTILTKPCLVFNHKMCLCLKIFSQVYLFMCVLATIKINVKMEGRSKELCEELWQTWWQVIRKRAQTKREDWQSCSWCFRPDKIVIEWSTGENWERIVQKKTFIQVGLECILFPHFQVIDGIC